MERQAWCERFVAAWAVMRPETPYGFVLLLAQRTFEYEGAHTTPELAARDHIALRQRIQSDRGKSDRS
jgi:hypothetical protein